MSKRAESAALKAYPERLEWSVYGPIPFDGNYTSREKYLEGYEQAEKDLGWHSVEESLPPVDEEVIVLTDEINETLLPDASFVCVAHIVDPDLTVDVDGISYRPVSYNGWNVPGVKFWMPMPKLVKVLIETFGYSQKEAEIFTKGLEDIGK